MNIGYIINIAFIIGILESILYFKFYLNNEINLYIGLHIFILILLIIHGFSYLFFKPKTKYGCKNNICDKQVGGIYNSLEDCKKDNKCYKCNYGKANRTKKLDYVKDCSNLSSTICNNSYSYTNENNKKLRRSCNFGSICRLESDDVYQKRFVQNCNIANGNKDECHKYYSKDNNNNFYKCFYNDKKNKDGIAVNTCTIGKKDTSKLPNNCPSY